MGRILSLFLVLYLASACSSNPSAPPDAAGADGSSIDAVASDGARPPGSDGAAPDAPPPGNAVTVATIEAAEPGLTAGMDDVALSADGTVRYRRRREGGRTVHEEIVVNGRVVESVDQMDTQTIELRDKENDGVLEWRLTVTRGATPDANQAVIEVDPTGMFTAPAHRETYTPMGTDAVEVVIEDDDGSGSLSETRRYTTTPDQPTAVITPPESGGPGGCSDAQAAQLASQLRDAIDSGIACSQRMGLNDLANAVSRAATGRGFSLTCGYLPGSTTAMANPFDGWFGDWTSGPLNIRIDPSKFFALTVHPRIGQEVLWHEVMHLMRGSHDSADIADESMALETDPFYACSALCFRPTATKCECAACLHTSVCDPRCAGFAECMNPQVRSLCLCSSRMMWYSTPTECRTACPSGIACFAAGCRDVNYQCPPPGGH